MGSFERSPSHRGSERTNSAARLLNNLPNVAWMANTKVIDAILASAAAPVFFPPHGLPLTPGGNAFVDGGVFADNPRLRRSPPCLGEAIRRLIEAELKAKHRGERRMRQMASPPIRSCTTCR